jgi:hypothetical protein
MTSKAILGNFISWIFGFAVFIVGMINTFWGNDTIFGIFIACLAFAFFPPVNDVIGKWLGFSIPLIAKIMLAVFIIWVTLGVGELFAKIALMRAHLQ